MSDKPQDLLSDPLAQAALTDSEREIWGNLRSELIIARSQIEQLQTRIRILERQSAEEGVVQTILTRPEFNREVARMLAFDERYGGLSSILYFDIENLTDIIKGCGRQVSEAMIRCLCDTLAHKIRNSDILGRLATDEFGVLLARCDNASAWKKGESLVAAVYDGFKGIEDLEIQPIISYGAYTFREKEDVGTGLKQAAQAVTTIKFED